MSGAAKLGDRVVAVDTHIVMVPSPGGPVPTPVPSPFDGLVMQDLSSTVMVDNLPVAIEGSVALNTSPHVPAGGPFQWPPSNRARVVVVGPRTVKVDNKLVARGDDLAETCNDPVDAAKGQLVANSTVKVG